MLRSSEASRRHDKQRSFGLASPLLHLRVPTPPEAEAIRLFMEAHSGY